MGLLFGIILITIVTTIFLLIAKQLFWYGKLKSVKNKHVVVTGGSSGIGKSVAILAAKYGANVTIIARDLARLELARNEILRNCKNRDVQKVEYLSLDVSDNYENVEKSLHDIEKIMGPIYMLINCAGTAICSKIEDTTVDNLKKMFNINFMGTYNCIKAVIPKMKSAKEGIIVLTSSQAGLLGVFGYSAYSSSKFALRGLAESIAMELKPHNISVTLSFPPDTDTPGFAIEELSKPIETKMIAQTAGVVSPDAVAEKLFKDALAGRFFSTVGMEGFIITNLCCGMSPFSSIGELILQSLLMGFLRIISAFYLITFNRIVVNCMKTRDKNKKSE